MLELPGAIERMLWSKAALRLSALLLLAASTAQAQEFTFTSYGEGSGLTNLNGTALLQDQAGVVWAGTQNGVFTADGDRFEKNRDVAASGFESVRALSQDGAGRIWIGDGDHLGFWQNGKSQVLSSINLHVMSHEVMDLFVLPGQQDGVYLLKAGVLQRVASLDHQRSWAAAPALTQGLVAAVPDLATISSAAAAGNTKLWVGCGRALCIVDLLQQKAIRFGIAAGVPEDQWLALHVTRSGEVWARGAKHVVLLRRATHSFEQVQGLPADCFANMRHQLLIEDGAGRMILNLTRGLAVGGRTGWRVFRESNGLPDDEIDAVMPDQTGALWLTSLGHGILRWRGYGNWEGWSKSDGLPSNIVWSVTRDAGNHLWIATNAGLSKLDLTTHSIRPEGFSSQRLFAAVIDSRQHLWLDDATGRILDFDPVSGVSRVAATGLDRVFQMHVDQAHRVWACSRKGLLYFSSEDGWKQPHPVNDPRGPAKYAWSITEAPDGTIWVGGEKRLFRLRGTQWREVHLPFDEANHQNRMIAAAPDGTLWVQDSLPTPVVHLAISGDVATVISKVDATQIPSDNTTFLEMDRTGWLWVGSDDGVHVFNGKEWALCTAEDGLLWNDTDFHAFSQDPDGSIWIGTSAGVSHVLHPELIFAHASPQVQLLDVRMAGQPIPEGTPNFDLRKPTLSFRFRNVNYDRGSAVVAQYKLDGEEADWHDTSGTLVRFPALQPGAYDLRVHAYDQRFSRSSSEEHIHFLVLEPWWKRKWFLVFESIATGLFLFALWRLSVSLLVARQRQLARLVASRTKELESEKKELLSTRSALLEIARKDSLTGLLNRSAIFDELDKLCQVSTEGSLPLAVVMADLDSFKRVNDTHGHLAGDAVLRECAIRIRNKTRECDLVGRYGGEELLIVLVGLPREAASARIEEIRNAIASAPFRLDSVKLHVTCSFGVAWFNGGESRVEELLSLADAALYRAKRNGRNRVEYCLPSVFAAADGPYQEGHSGRIQ